MRLAINSNHQTKTISHNTITSAPVNGIMDPSVSLSKPSPVRKTENMNSGSSAASTFFSGGVFSNAPSPEFDTNVMVS